MCDTVSSSEHASMFLAFNQKAFSSYATDSEFSFPAEGMAYYMVACASHFCSRILLILRGIFSIKDNMDIKIRSCFVCIIFQK